MELEELRAIIGTGPSDAVLEAALAAASEALENRYGPETPCTEYLQPFGQWVKLGRRAEEVASVIEDGDTLEDTDYTLWPGGRYLRRLVDDEPTAWCGRVEVEYTPLSETAERDRITVALVKLDIANNPGLTGITVGPWSEQYSQSEDGYASAREAILSSLRPPNVGVW